MTRFQSDSIGANPPCHLWSVSAAVRLLSEGNRSVVFATVDHKPKLVFKSTTRSEAALLWLSEVHSAAEAAGFMVPRLIPSKRGLLSEMGWTAEPFLDGVPLSPNTVEVQTRVQRFHQEAKDLPQRPGFLSAGALCKENIGGDIDFTTMPSKLVAASRAAFAELGPERTIVHADLTKSNLLKMPNGDMALIDWDEARRDHPLFDRTLDQITDQVSRRARLAWEIACCWTKEPDRALALSKEL